MRLLLKKGADITAKDKHQRTAVSRAIGEKARGSVQLLLEKGADVAAKIKIDGRRCTG